MARGGLDDRHVRAGESDVALRLGQRTVERLEKFVRFPSKESVHVLRCTAGQSKLVFQIHASLEQEKRITMMT